MSKITTFAEKREASKEITSTVSDLASLKITVPLGNPNFRLVHTNQFLYTKLPKSVTLKNLTDIGKAMNSIYNRYEGYELNRWYIEKTTIKNDGNSFTMDIETNPFASSILKFRDDKQSLEKAYADAMTSNTGSTNTNTTSSSNSNNNRNRVASTVKTNLKGGEGKLIDNLVKKICKKERDALKKAKLIHNWLLKNLKYEWYYNSRYNSPESCYKHRKNLNCADTSRLTASMLRSAGVDNYVVKSNARDHYFTVIKAGGKLYCSDATSNCRPFNHYWVKGGRACVGKKFKGKSSYSQKCGKNPCS